MSNKQDNSNNALHQSLGRIEGKVELILSNNKDLISRIERIEDNADDLRDGQAKIKQTIARHAVIAGLGITILSSALASFFSRFI